MPAFQSKSHAIVLENWFRVLLGTSFSIKDILKLIVEFAKNYEAFTFDPALSKKSLKIENEGRIVCKTELDHSNCNTFGTVVAEPGSLYHWKVKIVSMSENISGKTLNLGVIEANECEECLKEDILWHLQKYGYSYWSGNGKLYNDVVTEYGDPYGQNDVIDIWVDLRDTKRELVFAKNDKKYGVIKLRGHVSAEYKLAVAMYGEQKKIELVSFEMC